MPLVCGLRGVEVSCEMPRIFKAPINSLALSVKAKQSIEWISLIQNDYQFLYNNLSEIRLQSGETRKVLWECRATLGTVSNQENNLRSLGKAGAKRWRGVRPTVRGVAMNPVDHPHGGGEGRTSGGRHPSTPWGKPTKGYKTRKNQRTDDLIIRRRGKK